jgi:hypothetical protein
MCSASPYGRNRTIEHVQDVVLLLQQDYTACVVHRSCRNPLVRSIWSCHGTVSVLQQRHAARPSVT